MQFAETFARLSDPYDRVARLYPALLVVAPAAVFTVCQFGGREVVVSSVTSVLAFSGVAFAMGRIARNAGKQLERKLFRKWGGAPTTQLLRHSDHAIDSHTKARYHAYLSKVLGKPMPTPEEELLRPGEADEFYRASTLWLINHTRGSTAYPLLHKENTAYGFQRNTLGLKPLGILIATICLPLAICNGHALSLTYPHVFPGQLIQLTPTHLLSLCVSLVMLLAWLFFFNESAVKLAGFAYAERLLQTCDHLPSPERKSVKPGKMVAKKAS